MNRLKKKEKPMAAIKTKKKAPDKKFIQKAIKRPGALTRRAKREGRTVLAQAQFDKTHGTKLEKDQANFFLNVLKKVKRNKKKGGKSLMKEAA